MQVKISPKYEAKDKVTGAPLVIKLLKSLYGLEQGAKSRHGIVTFLMGTGFKTLESDPCVYIFNGTTAVKQRLATDEDSTNILTM